MMVLNSLRRFGFVTLLMVLVLVSVSAFGTREEEQAEPAVHAVDGGAVREGVDVVVVGRIALVGSEPNTHLIVRTDAPDKEGRWALEITGDLAEQIFDHQNELLRLEGQLDRVPAGADPGRLSVSSFVVVDQ